MLDTRQQSAEPKTKRHLVWILLVGSVVAAIAAVAVRVVETGPHRTIADQDIMTNYTMQPVPTPQPRQDIPHYSGPVPLPAAPINPPVRIMEFTRALDALRADNVPEEDALRVAAKLTPSEFGIAIRPLTDDPQVMRGLFWAALAFPALILAILLFRRVTYPHVPADQQPLEGSIRRLEYRTRLLEERTDER